MRSTMAVKPVDFELERSAFPTGLFRFNFALAAAQMTPCWPRTHTRKGS